MWPLLYAQYFCVSVCSNYNVISYTMHTRMLFFLYTVAPSYADCIIRPHLWLDLTQTRFCGLVFGNVVTATGVNYITVKTYMVGITMKPYKSADSNVHTHTHLHALTYMYTHMRMHVHVLTHIHTHTTARKFKRETNDVSLPLVAIADHELKLCIMAYHQLLYCSFLFWL